VAWHRKAVVFLTCFAAVALWGWPRDATGADAIQRAVEIIASPHVPDERPPEISERDWDTRPHEAWVRLQADARGRLTEAGARAVPALLGLVERTDRNSVKVSALTALSLMEPAELAAAGPAMTQLLTDEHAGVRYLALKVVGVTEYREALPGVVKLATDEEPVVRLMAADALGGLAGAEGVPALLALTADEDKAVRLHAIAAMGRAGLALDTMPTLIEKLRSDDVNEREAAVDAIRDLLGYDIGSPHVSQWMIVRRKDQREPIIADLEAWWAEAKAGQTFRVQGSPELSFRINVLLHEEEATDERQARLRREVRLKAVELIRRWRDLRSVDYLALQLSDEDKEVRKQVAEAASAISGVRLEYASDDSEGAWFRKADAFRNAWKRRKESGLAPSVRAP